MSDLCVYVHLPEAMPTATQCEIADAIRTVICRHENRKAVPINFGRAVACDGKLVVNILGYKKPGEEDKEEPPFLHKLVWDKTQCVLDRMKVDFPLEVRYQ